MSWIAVGVAVVGAGSSILGGMGASKDAKEAGKEQAKIIMATAEENLRRRSLDLEQRLGGITAAIGASNLQMSGSSERYKNMFEANIRSEMGWDKQKARMDASAAKKTGQAQGTAAMYSGLAGAAGYAASGYTAFAAHKAG